MHDHRASTICAFADFFDLVSECGFELIMLTNVCECISVLMHMCVYKVPAANDPQVFLYGVLKSAIVGVFWGERSGEFLHRKQLFLLFSIPRLALVASTQ